MDASKLRDLIDKVIGKSGPLRTPAWWMRRVLLSLLEWLENTDKKVNNAIASLKVLERTDTQLVSQITNLRSDVNSRRGYMVVVTEDDDLAAFTVDDGISYNIPAGQTKRLYFTKRFTSNNEFLYNNPFVDARFADFSQCKDLDFAFSFCSVHPESFLKIDTYSIVSMAYTFEANRSLLLDLRGFDTQNCESMRRMFSKCYAEKIDLSSFDTTKVTNMEYMFAGCRAVKDLILGPKFFATESVEIIDFSECDNWEGESVVTSLVTNRYRRYGKFMYLLALKLNAKTRASLTDEQVQEITSDGYEIIVV